MTTSVEDCHMLLEISLMDQLDTIEENTEVAMNDLDDLVDAMNLRGDYVWFKDMVSRLFPLGLTTFIDMELLKKFAATVECSHIVDALIDELSPRGAGIELHRRD